LLRYHSLVGGFGLVSLKSVSGSKVFRSLVDKIVGFLSLSSFFELVLR